MLKSISLLSRGLTVGLHESAASDISSNTIAGYSVSRFVKLSYGKTEYYENEDNSFTNLETEYPAIVFDDISDAALSCKPTVSPLDNNEIDFNISFDESDDEDYMIVFDENTFSCKIIYVDNLKTDSENENDKINIPSSPSPEPMIGYFDDLDFFKDFENEFLAMVYNDLKSKSDPLNEPLNNTTYLRDLAIRKSTLWYTLKKTCVELVRENLKPHQHTFALEL
ncbi:hypothetical protein Tco_1294970 [Tanacetum coccineum]